MRTNFRSWAWTVAGIAAGLPIPVLAQPRNTIMGRLINVASVFGPFQTIDDTEPGAGLRRAARIIGLVIGSLLAFLGVVFMLLMISSGIRWMTARGNESEIEKAKETIKSAAIGLLVVVLSYAFVTLISRMVVDTGLLRG
ncbi:MAG: hypothetical protein Q7S23_03500 [bacterium]|nr:hypothetical protein [bacterium]